MAATQIDRQIAVSTPLGDDLLLFRAMHGHEQLGRAFCFELELLSEDHEIALDAVLGQNISIAVNGYKDDVRYFNGYVTAFKQCASIGRYASFHATVRPWLWFLTQTSDCRIFQHLSVPDIVKSIFREHGFTDFDDALSASYRRWEYCVQYREDDFCFVSRLMEQEGIYYYFDHENGKHTLVLCDSFTSHNPTPGYAEVPYYPPDEHARRERDHLSVWSIAKQVQSGAYALRDFDFEKPLADLSVKSMMNRKHAFSQFERYDYPGEYAHSGDGETYARGRIEALQAHHEVATGAGNVRGLKAGALFALRKHPRKDHNREYLITSARYALRLDAYEGIETGEQPVFHCELDAIDAEQPYRSARSTPKPVVQGPQTAIVVGKAGEDIWTDRYGRVKVQFHWDRYGQANENSSCWIRVAQMWAGRRWGTQFIPRVGQEVIVDFEEGDPDRPLITGRVYNALNMPPHELPANATVSTIKSNSSKGGQGFNELRFEDKKGAEHVFLHAERDYLCETRHDKREQIGNDAHCITEGHSFTRIQGDSHATTDGDTLRHTKGTVSAQVGEDLQIRVAGTHALDSGNEIHLKAGMTVVVESGANITIQTATGSIDMNGGGISLTCGASTLNVGPAGIYSSIPIRLAPGLTSLPLSGLEASPDTPVQPTNVANENAGESHAPAQPQTAPGATSNGASMALVLRKAARDGTAFCAICNG